MQTALLAFFTIKSCNIFSRAIFLTTVHACYDETGTWNKPAIAQIHSAVYLHINSVLGYTALGNKNVLLITLLLVDLISEEEDSTM